MEDTHRLVFEHRPAIECGGSTRAKDIRLCVILTRVNLSLPAVVGTAPPVNEQTG